MSSFTDELLKKHDLTPDAVHLPAGGVAVFGRTGNGKSSLFYGSRFLDVVLIADTGSTSHRLYARDPDKVVDVDHLATESPIEQVIRHVRKSPGPGLLDSWSTLQEQQVAWYKRTIGGRVNGGALSMIQHGDIVGQLRDLALVLARAPWFTVFNTTAGGQGKTPAGQLVVYPSGAITGYQSLNGTEANKETILARWPSVWGVFQGYKTIPRGLYLPFADWREKDFTKYAPLKDPMLVLRDTNQADDKHPLMVVPDLRRPDNAGRCFGDELLVEISAKFPRRRPAAASPPPPPPPEARPARPPK